MKLTGDKANNYFTNPDTNHTAILIYGADTMRVSLTKARTPQGTHWRKC